MTQRVKIPKPTRPVAFREHQGVFDFYIAPTANVTWAELRACAEEFGDVKDEGRYLRLFIDPTYDQRDVARYFNDLFPPFSPAEADADVTP